MQDHEPEGQTAIRTDLGAIFVSLELSRSSWLITSVSISAEAGPGISAQLGPTPAVEEAVVPGVHGGDPRASRSALTSDEAARVGRRCGPPGAIRGARIREVRCGF
jgi:hypothetical protein